MSTKTCLFDLGNVLIFFSHEKMCQALGGLLGQSATTIKTVLMDSGLWLDLESGALALPQLHRRLCQQFRVDCSVDQFAEACSDIFEPNLAMIELLDELKASGVRLVLLSNISATHLDRISSHFDVLDRFDELIVSFRVGAVKPSPAIYAAALAAIRCDPTECYYTDDIAPYVDAAAALGIDAVLFVDAQSTRRQLNTRGLLA